MNMHAAIVAGGLGTRAAGMTAGRIPKALLPVAGVPIIFRQMRVLRREGVRKLSVLAGHLGDQMQQALAPEAAALGLMLQIVVEQTQLGTAGCLAALDPEEKDILIVYGDMLFDVELAPLIEFHQRCRALITLVAHPNDHPLTSDLVVQDGDLVKAILPRGRPREHDCRNLVPAGMYLASSEFFAQIPRGAKSDMIRDLLPALLASGAKLAVYNTPEYLRDIGTPPRHAEAERDLLAGQVERMNGACSRPAIFFDCDGVLNEEPGSRRGDSERCEDYTWCRDCPSARCRSAHSGRYKPSSVAKGFVTFDGLNHTLGRLEALLAADRGVLDRIYYCPHHPEGGFPRARFES